MRPQHSAQLPEPTIQMKEGWHCLHIYYKINQNALQAVSPEDRAFGRAEVIDILNPSAEHAPARILTSVVSGHRADLGLMLMDPDPLRIDAITQRLRACRIGTALESTWSFVSITEVSEYVPS